MTLKGERDSKIKNENCIFNLVFNYVCKDIIFLLPISHLKHISK